MPNYT